MKTIVMTLLVAALLVVVGVAVFIYSGAYDVSASTPHSAMSNWVMATTRQISVTRQAHGIDVPDLQSESLRHAGINDFEAMCVGCHGAPGKEPEPMGQGLNPPAPDLQQVAQQRTPAQLFWATKHGIKMTGMPAWGATHNDEALWPVVALLTALPEMDAEEYSELLAQAEGMGHHASDSDDHDHAHSANGDGPGAHDHAAEGNAEEQPEHDHSSHEH